MLIVDFNKNGTNTDTYNDKTEHNQKGNEEKDKDNDDIIHDIHNKNPRLKLMICLKKSYKIFILT